MDEIMRVKPGRATPRVRSVTPKSIRAQPKGLSSSRLSKVEFLRHCLAQHSPQNSTRKPSSSELKGRAHYRKMGSSFAGFDQQRMMSMIYGTVANQTTRGGEGGGVLFEKMRHSLSEQMLAKTTLRTPVYKTQEEYYDEVIVLKKKIKELTADNSTLKLKVRRLEENFLKKEKEVEQLLDPAKNNDARRTLADGKADTGSVVHSLKQKVLKLEHQLREREAAYSKLQSDLKTTKIEEMKIQLETYYSELLRLRSEKPAQPNQTSRDQLSVVGSGGRVKELTATILKMSVEKTHLVAENKSLKEDLGKFLESKDAQKEKSEEVNENLTQRQIMSVLAKLEQKFEKRELLEGEAVGKPNRITEAKDGASAVVEEELATLRKCEIALKEEVEMQKSEIAKLQQERAYYLGKYQEEELENTKLCNEIAMLRKEIKLLQLKNSNSNQSNNVSTSEKLPVDANGVVPRPRERLSRRRSSVVNAGKEFPQKVEQFKQNRAAKVIQKKWTQHRATEIEKDEAAELIQGAWKGHRTCQDTNNRLETLLKEGETEERRDNDRRKDETRTREERNGLESDDRIKASIVTENSKDNRKGEIEKNNTKSVIDRNAKILQNNAGEKSEGTKSVKNEEQRVNGRKSDVVVDDDTVELIQATMKGHMNRSKQIKSHISNPQTSQPHNGNGKASSSSSSAAEKPGTHQSSSTRVPSAVPTSRASASDDEEIEEDLEIGGDEEEDEENIISSRPLSHS